MIQFMAGQKGQGKTRKLIDMANTAIKEAAGTLVFIDDDRRHTRDIDYDIRFVEAGKGTLTNYREFIGYIRGILSQNADIEHIYVDGLSNIVKTLDNEDLEKLVVKLDAISKQDEVDFTISINCDPSSLPENIQALLI